MVKLFLLAFTLVASFSGEACPPADQRRLEEGLSEINAAAIFALQFSGDSSSITGIGTHWVMIRRVGSTWDSLESCTQFASLGPNLVPDFDDAQLSSTTTRLGGSSLILKNGVPFNILMPDDDWNEKTVRFAREFGKDSNVSAFDVRNGVTAWAKGDDLYVADRRERQLFSLNMGERINTIALSDDYVVVGSTRVRVFTPDGRLVSYLLIGREQDCISIAISPDGTKCAFVIAGSGDKLQEPNAVPSVVVATLPPIDQERQAVDEARPMQVEYVHRLSHRSVSSSPSLHQWLIESYSDSR